MSTTTIFGLDKRKLLSALAHGSIFFSSTLISVAVPVALYSVSDDPVVKQNAQEAINFHFNVWAYGIVVGLLCWVLIGWFLLPVLLVYHWAMPIWAIVNCLKTPETSFRYPFIFRLF